jgi:iron complex transport system substrate-binding protein
MNIPVVYNGDWLEETPLGRAEWIKFFGALLDQRKLADSIFNNIEQQYLKAKQIAKSSIKKPTVLSGSLFKDVWSVPAGESFIATFFRDANLDYLWKQTKGSGSLQLSLESVLDKGQQADFWIGAGLSSSKTALLQNNRMYQNFDAFKNDKVFGIGQKRGKTGGYIYFELAPVRPDLVLKDIIKITNPELLPNYTATFFEKIE